ncbi:MAG: hypothetical protein IJW06_06670 [Clostridia bacterium]|nr:hypothetical protein [Clostridia bacterium]
MKKTLCAILAVATIGMGLISCGKKPENGFKPVESKTCDYTFSCPESWTVSYTDGMLSAYNPDDVSKANVTAFSFSHGQEKTPSAMEYWETYQKQLSDTFGGFTLNDVKETELSKRKVAHADYSVTIGDEAFECETILVIYEDNVYTLTLTQGAKTDLNSENYNDHSDEFAEIIKTFRIK